MSCHWWGDRHQCSSQMFSKPTVGTCACSSNTNTGQNAFYYPPVESSGSGNRREEVYSSHPLQEVKMLLGFLGKVGGVTGSR